MLTLAPPASFSLFGLVFHWYGILVGLGIWLGWSVVSKKAEQIENASKILDQSIGWLILGGFIGARTWHVATDWNLYASDPIALLYVWNGGMSILGAIAGVLLVWLILIRNLKIPKKYRLLVPDLLAYGAPLAQIVGRIGNWINQELVGYPTGLPWGISILQANRPSGFENEEYYHPLFAYEIIALVVVWRILWLRCRNRIEAFGTGQVLVTYLALYLSFRFLLDFIRLEKGTLVNVGGIHLGINQVLMVIVLLTIGIYWRFMRNRSRKRATAYASSSVLGLTLLVMVVGAGVWLVWSKVPQSKLNVTDRMDLEKYTAEGQLSPQTLEGIRDHSIIAMTTSTGIYRVEVVNTPESTQQGLSGRQEIGADAMLFVFSNKSVRTFWMPNMKFDLDMVWLDDGVVRSVTQHVPAPDSSVPDSDLVRYSSGREINQVIEVPAGRSDQMGLLPGKTVIFSGL